MAAIRLALSLLAYLLILCITAVNTEESSLDLLSADHAQLAQAARDPKSSLERKLKISEEALARDQQEISSLQPTPSDTGFHSFRAGFAAADAKSQAQIRDYEERIRGLEDKLGREEVKNLKMPTDDPTAVPTKDPTKTPTKDPTNTPTKAPTEVPSEAPTVPQGGNAIKQSRRAELRSFAVEQIRKPGNDYDAIMRRLADFGLSDQPAFLITPSFRTLLKELIQKARSYNMFAAAHNKKVGLVTLLEAQLRRHYAASTLESCEYSCLGQRLSRDKEFIDDPEDGYMMPLMRSNEDSWAGTIQPTVEFRISNNTNLNGGEPLLMRAFQPKGRDSNGSGGGLVNARPLTSRDSEARYALVGDKFHLVIQGMMSACDIARGWVCKPLQKKVCGILRSPAESKGVISPSEINDKNNNEFWGLWSEPEVFQWCGAKGKRLGGSMGFVRRRRRRRRRKMFSKTRGKIKAKAKKVVSSIKKKGKALKGKFKAKFKAYAWKMLIKARARMTKGDIVRLWKSVLGKVKYKSQKAPGFQKLVTARILLGSPYVLKHCTGYLSPMLNPKFVNIALLTSVWDWTTKAKEEPYKKRKIMFRPADIKHMKDKFTPENYKLLEDDYKDRFPTGCWSAPSASRGEQLTYLKPKCSESAATDGLKLKMDKVKIIIERRELEGAKLACAALFTVDSKTCTDCCCTRGPVQFSQSSEMLYRGKTGDEQISCKRWFLMQTSLLNTVGAWQTAYGTSSRHGFAGPPINRKCLVEEQMCRLDACDAHHKACLASKYRLWQGHTRSFERYLCAKCGARTGRVLLAQEKSRNTPDRGIYAPKTLREIREKQTEQFKAEANRTVQGQTAKEFFEQGYSVVPAVERAFAKKELEGSNQNKFFELDSCNTSYSSIPCNTSYSSIPS